MGNKMCTRVGVIYGIFMYSSISIAAIECWDGGGRNQNRYRSVRDTLLHRAVNNTNVREVERLSTTHNIDINARGYCDKTPLYYAVEKQHDKIVSQLIRARANVEAKDDDGKTPLFAAAVGKQSIVKALIKAQANVNVRNKYNTAVLHSAARSGTPEVVQLLLDANADPNAIGRNPELPRSVAGGDTPLHVAAFHGKAGVAELLVRSGADVEARDQQGRTPLDVARRRGHGNTAKVLEDYAQSQKSFFRGELICEDPLVPIYGVCLVWACVAFWCQQSQ